MLPILEICFCVNYIIAGIFFLRCRVWSSRYSVELCASNRHLYVRNLWNISSDYLRGRNSFEEAGTEKFMYFIYLRIDMYVLLF